MTMKANDDGVAALVDACTAAWEEYYDLPYDCPVDNPRFARAEAKAYAMVDALETITGKLWGYDQHDRRMFVCK